MIHSFVTFMTLLPAILPTWQETPMPRKFLDYETEAFKSEATATNKQIQALEITDPLFKLKVLAKLSVVNDENTKKILYDYLNKANDPLIKTATLNYLYKCSVIDNKISTIEGLINAQTDEGVAAARLYCKFPKADLQKVTKLLSTISLQHKNILIKALSDSKRLPATEWIKLYEESDTLPFRLSPVGEVAAAKTSPTNISFLNKVLRDGSTAEHAAIAMNLNVNPTSMPLLKKLLTHKHATVRAMAATNAAKTSSKEFEAILIKLTQDKDSSVRKAAINSLTVYPTIESAKALYKNLKDKELLVQKEAKAALLSISKTLDIESILVPGIQFGNSGTRRWSAHILGKLNKKRHGEAILAQLLKEDNFDARSEQVYALGQFKLSIPESLIKKLSTDHERVRAAFVHYLGKIDQEKYFTYMSDAALKDPVGAVRWAALEAAGNNGSPWFNKTLITIMFDLKLESLRDYQDRAVACWAAGKLRSLEKKLIDQMILFMNSPTIPVFMGPNTYDNPHVLLSIAFAFADQYHRGGEKKDYFYKYAKSFHFRFTKDRRSVEFPRNLQNDNYADQMWSYLNNKEAPRVSRPARRMSWDFKESKK